VLVNSEEVLGLSPYATRIDSCDSHWDKWRMPSGQSTVYIVYNLTEEQGDEYMLTFLEFCELERKLGIKIPLRPYVA
jgi:hypothetical protein